MSLFQCDSCGCIENTALTNAYMPFGSKEERAPEAFAGYKKILGLTEKDEFGAYCSACSPIWFDGGNYGIGPIPPGHIDRFEDTPNGQWHGKFARRFLPKGMFHTNDDGNLSRIDTLDSDTSKYELESEFEPGVRTIHPNVRLPRPGTADERDYLQRFRNVDVVRIEGHNNVQFVPRFVKDKPSKPSSTMTAAAMALVASAGLGAGALAPPSRRYVEPHKPTPEEEAAAKQRGEEKMRKAQEKRDRKSRKRFRFKAASLPPDHPGYETDIESELLNG